MVSRGRGENYCAGRQGKGRVGTDVGRVYSLSCIWQGPTEVKVGGPIRYGKTGS